VIIDFEGQKVSLDSNEKDATVRFVSHAHTDHTGGAGRGKQIISSPVTAEIIGLRMKKAVGIDYTDRFLNAELACAGHILGSRQIYLPNSASGRSVLYSGDFQVEGSLVAEPIEFRAADELIIDSTYPHPGISFDEKEDVMSAIQKYSTEKVKRGIVVFGAYSLGKSQEIIKILNEAGIVPAVSRKISDINRIYEKAGVALDYVSYSSNRDGFTKTMRGNFVAVVEYGKLGVVRERISRRRASRVFTAVASGFAKSFRFNTDVQFALSDHADFGQAVRYIEACNPKAIYTYGRNSDIFASNLRRAGYNAMPSSQYINGNIIAERTVARSEEEL